MDDYPGWSPYNYTLHNPVKLIDPDGNYVENCDDEVDSPTPKEIYESLLALLPKELQESIKSQVEYLQKQVKDFSWDKVAIGIESRGGVEITFGGKEEASTIIGNVVFLGGNDAGYVYSYYGGEAGAGLESSMGASVNAGKSVFIAYNYSGKGGHEGFDGDYTYFSGSVGVSTGTLTDGIDLGISGSYGVAYGDDWAVYSNVLSGSAGGGISSLVVLGMTGGVGNVKFMNDNVGKSKGFWETLYSHRKWFTFF